ncbi:hypothetical protein EDB81DRAFT_758546 [Dactylonectria macrodidyma]|uniref:FAD-binding PCMH-type domain-containing protein n=1 Tax=Dactylonectria macrodidyma TaxID=307937 RepID=A0A9P9F383_9HYPO|nr:hypothetical protein EDB81DRAFT_758546 [Dactylonectria macrodidyma]
MLRILATLLSSPCLVATLTSARTGLVPCDALVENGLGQRLLLAKDNSYEERLETYWSVSARLKPWCIVQPRTADEVSKVLQTLLDAGSGAGSWHIAVRGGGHNHWVGSNNVANGVTIDLATSPPLVLEFFWNSAYAHLAEHGVSLVGSRAGGVGVSGFLLGGGNSYYTGRRGFGCDNVVNYEVVLSDGRIINANKTSHVGLYRALKGGGSNFGIVTRFDLEAFPAKNLYGGSRTISTNYTDEILNAVVSFANHDESAADDSFTPTFMYNTGIAPNVIIDASILNVEGFRNTTGFNEVSSIPAVSEDLQSRSLASLASESTVDGTSRSIWLTLTFKANLVVLRRVVERWEQFVSEMEEAMSADGFQAQMNFQHLPTFYGRSRRGGNVLGLDSSLTDNSVLWVNIVNVQTAEQEAIARLRTNTLRAELEDFAVSQDSNVQFRYLNYAEPSQDPLGGYGADNTQYIRDVAKNYDPDGLFQTRVPGGFKISRVG